MGYGSPLVTEPQGTDIVVSYSASRTIDASLRPVDGGRAEFSMAEVFSLITQAIPDMTESFETVSYTHLTLPTICSV